MLRLLLLQWLLLLAPVECVDDDKMVDLMKMFYGGVFGCNWMGRTVNVECGAMVAVAMVLAVFVFVLVLAFAFVVKHLCLLHVFVSPLFSFVDLGAGMMMLTVKALLERIACYC